MIQSKLFIVSLFTVFLTAHPGFCATQSAKATGTTGVSAAAWERHAKTTVGVGTGLAIYKGNTGWALNLGLLTKVLDDTPLFVGADLGVNFWNINSSSVTPASSSATGVQLLPTAIYGFRLADLESVAPYIGLSVGPNVYIESATDGAGHTRTETKVLLEALFRVGANFTLSRSFALNIEPKMGMLRSEFIFLPQVSAIISL